MSTIRFWWVRHAPVVGNNGRCYGNNDVDCDVSETNKFINLVKILPTNSFIYSSQLTRTIKTFKTAEEHGLTYLGYKIDNNFAEQNLGSWAGLKYDDLDKKTKELGVYHPNWLCDPTHTPPKGESYNDLYLRVVSSLKKIIQDSSNDDFVIFSHGGPIRAAISFALNAFPEVSLPFWIDNMSVTRLDFVEKSWHIKFINLVP
ncbi:MAG: hypothetical protein CFH32_01107 [Alphaproteobacteria bacterium MarineAlpha9_Bin2]|nr:MAG: hypothetical protein CFH31_00713 [Alphaproteobacteria bacterium MarineAlpha9_Bin1]PPR29405.1 MAG: hypothetical protein CFH32_01107 [Alphaproteobacteria bacterium MarineAlpha9_Bin2]